MRKRIVIGLLVLLIVGTASMAYGVSGYLSSFNSTYGTAGTAIASCSLCHTSAPDLNPYGDAYMNSGYNLRGIEGQDSDGDGFTNIAEINARTFPGNAASKPAPSDTTAPTVTAFTVPATSTSLTVSISMTATDTVGVTGYMVTESATAPAASAAGWSATAPTSRTFTTPGTKVLYAWAKDAAGNVSVSRSGSVTITLPDTTAPAMTGFTVPATATSLTVAISMTATDNVGVTGYMVNESATAPAASAAGWSVAAPTSYTFAAAGTKTLYAWAKDAAGNVSASRSGSVTISLPDTMPPTVSAFAVPATATSLAVTVSMAATDNVMVTGYMITESATAPAASAAGWSATVPTSYTFTTPGAKTLYAWAKDAAGNVSTSRSGSVTITLPDTTAPAMTGFTVPATATSLTVAISMTATDNVGVTGYMVNESATAPAAGAAGWSATAPTSYTFGTAGAKNLYAWAKDAAGNVSASRSGSVTITLATADTAAPTVTGFSIPATATALTVSISGFAATDNVGVTGYMVNESATAPAASAAEWSAAAPTSYTFGTAGAKTLYAWAKDAAGNVSASRSGSVTITISTADTAAPTVTIFTIPATSTSLTVAISMSATDNVGVTGYRVTEAATAPAAGATGWSATAPTSYTFAAAGTKNLYAWAKDAAGNVSASRSASVTITQSGGSADIFPVLADQYGAVYSYAPVAKPVLNTNLDDSKPLGVGPIATGGKTFNATVRTGAFTSPVDVYIVLQSHSGDPFNIYVMKPNKTFVPASYGQLVPWKKGIKGPINESLFGSIPVEKMQPGRYMIGLLITPSGSLKDYHFWMTGFTIPGEGWYGGGDDEDYYRSSYRITNLPQRRGYTNIHKLTAAPVLNTNPVSAMPIGVGALADGGTTLNITIGTAKFTRPTDLYLTLYMPASDPFNMYVMKPDKTFVSMSKLIARESDEDEGDDEEMRGIEPWKAGVTGPVNESLFGTLATSEVPGGVYRLGLLAAPAGRTERYSYWLTSFWVE